MTELRDRAIETARGLPPATQDEIARLMLQLAADAEPQAVLTGDQHSAIARSKAAAGRGEFVADERFRAVWAKHGL